jgi:hypothetical protein
MCARSSRVGPARQLHNRRHHRTRSRVDAQDRLARTHPNSPNTVFTSLNRQSAVYAREGVDLDVSTLADWVGAAAATLMPLVLLIRTHVFAAERIRDLHRMRTAAMMAGRHVHAKQFKRHRRELRSLRTRPGRHTRDIRRKIEGRARCCI